MIGDAELPPGLEIQRAWLEAEYDASSLKRWHSQRKHAGTAIPKDLRNSLAETTERFEALTEHADASKLVKAQAHLAIGSLPLWLARQSKSSPLSHAAEYRQRQAKAAAQVHSLLEESLEESSGLTMQELAFCWGLGVLLVVNGINNNSDAVALPVPPRCYEIQEPPDTWWQLRLYRFSTDEEMPLRVSPTAANDEAQVHTVPPRTAIPEESEDPQRLLVVRACVKKIAGEQPTRPEGVTLQETANFLARSTGIIGRKATAVLKLPTITPNQQKTSAPSVVELAATQAAPLRLEGVSGENLFTWYEQQVNGRHLTPREGDELGALLLAEAYPEPTIPRELILLNRLRLECAVANPATARIHLGAARDSLGTLQRWDSKNPLDVVDLYESAIDIERIKVYQKILSNEPLDAAAKKELCSDLASLLCEIYAETKRTGSKRTRDLLPFIRPLLHSVLIMRQEDPACLAVPSLPRQRGNEDCPGWDVSVWRLHENGKVSAGELRKIRLAPSGKDVVRQADVIVLPVPLVEKGYPWLQKLNEASLEDRKAARAEALLSEWQKRPFAYYRTALGIN